MHVLDRATAALRCANMLPTGGPTGGAAAVKALPGLAGKKLNTKENTKGID